MTYIEARELLRAERDGLQRKASKLARLLDAGDASQILYVASLLHAVAQAYRRVVGEHPFAMRIGDDRVCDLRRDCATFTPW